MAQITLTGITWNHTRGLLPLVATAQRFNEIYPEIEIIWHKRSLQEFADQPIELLAKRFDLLVIDHPFAGRAATLPVLLPLDQYLPAAYLADQAAHSVGVSHASYSYGGHQWALAIDAATPVSSYRPDLLERHNVAVPETWSDLLALAQRRLVTMPAIPVDSLMNFYMLCLAHSGKLFAHAEQVIDLDTGSIALEQLRELVSLCDPACLERNPIRTYEALIGSDKLLYCPFAYGYVNYARREYTRTPLQFGGLVTLNGQRLRSTLGGTGLAISAQCPHVDAAVAYAQFVASAECQAGMYVTSGGQPGHRMAWTDPHINASCENFFQRTLSTLDEAYLRPRYNGYILFQDHAGPIVHTYLRDGGSPQAAVEQINQLYRKSLNQ